MKAENKKKRVLHIIDSFGTGGAETWLLACVKYLHQHPEINLQFDFLASGGKKGVFDDEIKSYGSEIFYQKYSLTKFFPFRSALRKILNERKYVAIHNHLDFISGWHFLAASCSRPAQLISHLHNPWNFVENYVTNPFRWISFKLGRLLTALFATQITGTSDAVMDEYGYDKWPFSKKRVAPRYCGFKVQDFLFNETSKKKICEEFGWEESVHIALFIGRINEEASNKQAINQKNPQFAFNISNEICSKNDNWKFVFVGTRGKTAEKMVEEVAANKLSESIRFVGERRDIPTIMHAADILVFPSLWEGLGMVSVEAQAAGTFVLASENIPVEARLNDELFKVKLLSEGPENWADEVVKYKRIWGKSKEYNDMVMKSPFEIENSINNLIGLYKTTS